VHTLPLPCMPTAHKPKTHHETDYPEFQGVHRAPRWLLERSGGENQFIYQNSR